MPVSFLWDIECPHCQSTETINLAPYCDSINTYPRQMGSETEYDINLEEWSCNACKEKYSVKGSIWEYPEGAYNDDDLKTKPL